MVGEGQPSAVTDRGGWEEKRHNVFYFTFKQGDSSVHSNSTAAMARTFIVKGRKKSICAHTSGTI